MTKPEPLTRQVSGNYYSKLAIQPLEFATANRYDPCAFSILKYVTRWRDKGGVKDLEKALHIAQIRATDAIRVHLPHRGTEIARIRMGQYVSANEIPLVESSILDLLNHWVYSNRLDQYGFGERVMTGISTLIASATDETKEPV